MNLETPIEDVQGIGPKYAKRLRKLGIEKVRDLLFHLPSRYEDYSKITPAKELKEGDRVTVRGQVIHVSDRNAARRRLRITEAVIEDRTDTVRAVWFNQYFIKNQLSHGTTVLLSGKVSVGKEGLYLSNPVHEIERDEAAPIHTARVVPIYPETKGVTSRLVRFALSRTLPLVEDIEDPLPETIRKEKDLPKLFDALTSVHFPSDIKTARQARERFEFEELFYVQLAALKTKLEMQRENSPKIKTDVELTKKFVKSLPFQLTDSQKKAAWQILKDMEKPHPMNRLLEGDVGSGKTVVAAVAGLNAAKEGFQTALMTPTEILAEQHHNTATSLLVSSNFQIPCLPAGTANPKQSSSASRQTKSQKEPKQITIGLLTGSSAKLNNKTVKKPELKKKIAAGEIDILIGTHAVIQKDTEFKKLGLVVIDEQHRFGVSQRRALARGKTQKNTRKGTRKTQRGAAKQIRIPHLLSMTATPIPRSLALTIYGDLDLSLLKEMPTGRKKTITKIVPPNKRDKAFEFIRAELDKGRQAFVIFPLVEQSEKVQLRSAKEEHEQLSAGPFQNYNVGLLHGRMKAEEKENVMNDMKDGKIDVLVATTVVEVGIDVPNATIMMVDGADRFGLSQLHQLRGRVGRGEHQSYAFFLSESDTESTMKRLKALTKAKDGFELAEYDLAFRGSGDLYGARQSGMPDMAMASLTNVELIEEAREAANKLLEKDTKLAKHKPLKGRVEEMQEEMHFE